MNYPAMLATDSAGVGVADAVTQILSIASSVLTMIQENPYLVLYFVGGLIFVAIGIVKALK